MPRKYEMSWNRGQKRWEKMYRGHRLFVTTSSLSCPPTEEASRQAANDWFILKRSEIDGTEAKVSQQVAQLVSTENELLALIRKGEAAQKLLTILEMASVQGVDSLPGTMPLPSATRTLIGMDKGNLLPKRVVQNVLSQSNPTIQTEEDVEEELGRMGEAMAVKKISKERTIGTAAETYLGISRGRYQAGELSADRREKHARYLQIFRQYLGDETAFADFNEAKWAGFYADLQDRIAVGEMAGPYAKRVFGHCKNFIRYLWEMRLIEMPRNLESKLFEFGKTKIVSPLIYSFEEVAGLLGASTGQTRLHILLALNCGMGGKDISDLKQDEVDWTKGTIKRKRSKTADHEDVPVVTYLLWPETFALLKQWRSSEPETVLLTATGKKWVQGKDDGWRSDCVRSCFAKLQTKTKIKKGSFKTFRKTGATVLGEHKTYKFYSQYYLGHSPRSVADKNYVKPSDKEFFKACEWLGKQFGAT